MSIIPSSIDHVFILIKIALQNKDIEYVEQLINSVIINNLHILFTNCFSFNSTYDDFDILKHLLYTNRFSLLSQKDKNNILEMTILHKKRDTRRLVKSMISQGANPLKDKYNICVTEKVVMHSNRNLRSMLIFLLENGYFLQEGKIIRGLEVACHHGNIGACKILIRYIKDTPVFDSYIMIALRETVISGHTHIVRYLYKLGADIHCVDLFHKSVYINQVGTVRFLLRQGVDPNLRKWYGDTALHIAASENKIRMIKLLMESDINIFIVNFLGNTAFHLATRLETIILFLQNGADLHVPNNKHITPFMKFLSSGNQEIIEYLKDYPRIVSLRTLCLRVIKSTRMDISDWPPLMFLWPDEIEENKDRER